MEQEHVILTDLLGLAHLQLLQDSFANLTGITTVLVDPDGNPMTRPSNLHGYYKIVDATPKGQRHHLTTNWKLCVKNRRTGMPTTIVSPRSGLTTGAVPIFLDEAHLGSWIIGQVRLGENVNLRNAVDVLIDSGYAQQEAMQIAQKIPQVDFKEFENVMIFFEALTQTVLKLAQVNYDMVRTNDSLRTLTEQLDSTAQMLTKFTNSADVGMFVTDFFTGEILQCNESFARFFDSTQEALIGQKCWYPYGTDQDSFCGDCPHDKLLDETGHPSKPITWERYIEDKKIWTQMTNQAIYWVDGRLAQMVTFSDITQTKNMQQEFARLAYYDRVMQLPNALKMIHDIQGQDGSESWQLICFDIDSLRTINDVYSRPAGDKLLSEIAEWIQQVAPEGSVLYRVDGDEFAVMLKGQERPVPEEIAERINARFEEAWIFELSGEKTHIFCNISIGVIYNVSALKEVDIVNRIERTLVSAKKSGHIEVYDEVTDNKYKEDLRLELSLKTCIKEGMKGFEVHYQPIVDPASGMWCSLEALCRWTSPEFGPISPLVFIHKAEQMGLIGTVGRWVLETALGQVKAWGLDAHDNFILDVNLSPAQMTDETLASMIMEMLDRYDYPGDKLSLEITESTEMNFTSHTLTAIERLRRADVLVALDDFGTGYSSFNNLKNLPVSILKTERAFLEDIENDGYLQYLFYVMVELAHAADMKIIAEGVENEEQMHILLKNGVDYLQGYLFSKPLPAEELSHKLDHFRSVISTFRTRSMDGAGIADIMESGYTITPNLYKFLNQCLHVLMEGQDCHDAVSKVLQMIGERFSVCRAYHYTRTGAGEFQNTRCWHNPSLPKENHIDEHVTVPSLDGEFLDELWKRGILITQDVETLPGDLAQVLRSHGVKAVVLVPLYKGMELTGLIGFDDCRGFRDWLPEEVLLLHNICLMIGNVTEKQLLQQELDAKSGTQ